jgi:uncharacterized protein YidB (DUF937 family)
MGLLDQLLNQALGQDTEKPQRNQLLDLAMHFVQNYPGGLAGLVQQFTNAGYGQQARSWVGTGQNMPISTDDLLQVLGQGHVQSIEQRTGLSAQAASGGLAALLPMLVDQLTPQGHVEDQTDLASALSTLRGKLG